MVYETLKKKKKKKKRFLIITNFPEKQAVIHL